MTPTASPTAGPGLQPAFRSRSSTSIRLDKPCSQRDYYRNRFERDRGLKIDFVLGSPAFAGRVTGALIDRDERNPARFPGAPSDHAPVIVDLAD